MGSSHPTKRKIPPCGYDGYGHYIYRTKKGFVYSDGKEAKEMFLIKNQHVIPYKEGRMWEKDILCKVGYKTAYVRADSISPEEIIVLQKLCDNGLCEAYLSPDIDRDCRGGIRVPFKFPTTTAIVGVPKTKIEEVANYEFTYINWNLTRRIVYPVIFYNYISLDPIEQIRQKAREKLERQQALQYTEMMKSCGVEY